MADEGRGATGGRVKKIRVQLMKKGKKVKNNHLKPNGGRKRPVQLRRAEGRPPGTGFQTEGRTQDRQIDKPRQQPVIGGIRKLIADLQNLNGRQQEQTPDRGRAMDDGRGSAGQDNLRQRPQRCEWLRCEAGQCPR